MELYSLFSNLPLLTQFIIGCIAILWVYFFFFKFNASTVSNAPTILTSLGIFGTFLGIAIGLASFDPDNIQGSVPQLIDGLKTAFWSSIAGIFAAITIKLRHIYTINKKGTNRAAKGANIDDLINKLDDVNKALVGDDESTLLSQMKLARQDSNDRLDSLKKSMDSYMEKMTENNSNALIDALREVINDFNAKINEQFGENFKQLNEAVGKILEWQVRYREQMEEMITQQKQSTESMGTAVERYKEVISKSETFTDVAENLGAILEGLETQRTHLHGSLENLAKLVDSAKTGLPGMESKILEMVEEVTHGAKMSSESVAQVISETSKQFHDTNEQISKSVDVLDKALSEQLTKSLETMGSQLASLSEKFVQDYTPLTERLREVVSMSKGV